jgi:hypothetical protein
MSISNKYLLLVINIYDERIDPVYIGSRQGVIDYLSEYTLSLLAKTTTPISVHYETVWNYYDSHFYTEINDRYGYPLIHHEYMEVSPLYQIVDLGSVPQQ